MIAKIGHVVKYTDNTNTVRMRVIQEIRDGINDKILIVDNFNDGHPEYHVYSDEILGLFTKDEYPEYFL